MIAIYDENIVAIKIVPIDSITSLSVRREGVRSYIVNVPSKLLELDCLIEVANFNLCYFYILSSNEIYGDRIDRYLDLAVRRLIARMYQELVVFKDIDFNFKVSIKFPLASIMYLQLLRTRSMVIANMLEKYMDEDHILDYELYRSLIDLNRDFLKEQPDEISIKYIYKIDIDKILSALHRFASSIFSVAKIIEDHVNPIFKIVNKYKLNSLDKYILGSYDPYIKLIKAPQGLVIKNFKTYNRIFIEDLSSKEKKSSIISMISSSVSSSKRAFDVRNNRSVIIKNFNDPSNIKWIIVSPIVETLKMIGIKLTVNQTHRFWNEYKASVGTHIKGLNTPKIIYIDPWELILVREFIEGNSLVDLLEKLDSEDDVLKVMEKIISIMAHVHKENICIGDSKPDNFIVNDGSIYLIDLEQVSTCSNNIHKAWDIASHIYFLSIMLSEDKSNILLKNLDHIIRAYHNIVRDKDVIRSLSNIAFPSIMISLAIVKPVKSYILYKYYRRFLYISRYIGL